jgi:hypothetical protein
MTTRLKTIEYLIANSDSTTLAVSTNRDKSRTIYIPESGITFKSVTLRVVLRGDNTTAGTLATPTLQGRLAAAGFSTSDIVTWTSNSGESESWIYETDLTSYFTTNWSGTSMTFTARWAQTGIATANHGFKLLITYTYDDTSATHIKTIRIPVESTRTLLTTSFQTVGGATAVPAITGSYLPESGVTVRNVWYELWGTEATASTGDFTFETRVNGGATQSLWRAENALSSACWLWAGALMDGLDLSAARSLEARSLTTTNRAGLVGGYIGVTYEFDPAASTTVYNSILMGGLDVAGHVGGPTSGTETVWSRVVRIPEPGTITLKESAVCLFFLDAVGFGLHVAVGAQTHQAYTVTAGSVQCGQFSLVHRIDAGGQNGTAFTTLVRGANEYEIRVYSDTANTGWLMSGLAILNYTSGKAAEGVGAHSHPVFTLLMGSNRATAVTQVSDAVKACDIPESEYYVSGAAVWSGANGLAQTGQGQTIAAQRVAGEGAEGAGWEELYAGLGAAVDGEKTLIWCFGASRSSWRRHPLDQDSTRLDLTVARVFRMSATPATHVSMGMWVSYHALTWTVAGTITGSAGGTVQLKLHRAADNECVSATSRTGNGSYSFTWYDDTEDLYVTAWESNTLVGRSANGTAS